MTLEDQGSLCDKFRGWPGMKGRDKDGQSAPETRHRCLNWTSQVLVQVEALS